MRYQLQLLLLSVAAVVLIIVGAFFADWFAIHASSQNVLIDLRHMRVCTPHCASSPVGDLGGLYPGAAALAFWTALPLFVVIATQAGSRLLSGYAYPTLTKVGTGLGAVAFFSAFAAGFLAPPDGTVLAGFELTIVERMSGPIFLVFGTLAGLLTVRYASAEQDAPAEYKPVIVPKLGDSKDGATRLPVTPISTNKLPTPIGGELRRTTTPQPDARVKSPTTPPDARVKSPTTPPDARVKSPTTPPDARVKSPTTPPDARVKSPTTPPDARVKSPTTPPDARVKSPTTPPERAKPITGQQPAVPRTISTNSPDRAKPVTGSQPRIVSTTAPHDARDKSPSTPPSERAKPTTGQQPAMPRTVSTTAPPESRKASTGQIPPIVRPTSPTNPPVIVIPPATGPIDVSARLGAAPITSTVIPPATGPIDVSARLGAPPITSTVIPPATGPVDVSARLGAPPITPSITEALSAGSGDPISVTIRPPLPLPAPPPDDQIPVAPESGLVIRKRSPSTAPEPTELPLPPDIGLAIRTKPPSVAPPMMASVASALGVEPPSTVAAPTPLPEPPARPTPLPETFAAPTPLPEPPARPTPLPETFAAPTTLPEERPTPPRESFAARTRLPEPPGRPTPVPGLVKYAVTLAELTGAGIQATREDGFSKLIKWENIVGIVARRLPDAAPYAGLSFVDIVSSAGSTMRILPSTEIKGHPIDTEHDDHTERARAVVNLLAAQALDAKLDTATNAFANGTSKAPQLKDEKTLATHDARLA